MQRFAMSTRPASTYTAAVVCSRHSGHRLSVVLSTRALAGSTKSFAALSAVSALSGAASSSSRCFRLRDGACRAGCVRMAMGKGLAMEGCSLEECDAARVQGAAHRRETDAFLIQQPPELPCGELAVGAGFGPLVDGQYSMRRPTGYELHERLACVGGVFALVGEDRMHGLRGVRAAGVCAGV